METTISEFLSGYEQQKRNSDLDRFWVMGAGKIPRYCSTEFPLSPSSATYPSEYQSASTSTATPTPGRISTSQSSSRASNAQSPLSTGTRSSAPSAVTRDSTVSGGSKPAYSATTYTQPSQPQAQPQQPWQTAGIQTNTNHFNTLELWCECAGLTGCTATFAADDVSGWIYHHISHLDMAGSVLPNCLCWYCDHNAFGSNNTLDGEANFWTRMQHVREHILWDGYTQGDMRPDFFVVERLCERGEIEKSVRDYLMGYSELPPQFRRPRFEQQQQLRDPRAARRELMEISIAKEDRRRRRQARQR